MMVIKSGEVDSLLDELESGLDEALVPVGIFNDASVFDTEMDRIFSRDWVFVAHESEIPSNGDYVLRKIGLDSVIVNRDSSGNINVMSNHCRHRGTEVCQSHKGNASHFKCPYHGWSFKNNGDWAGAPHMLEAYGGRLDKKEWGLLHAPHVDIRQGLIFASLDPEAGPLDEYLGGMGWLMDAFFGLAPEGMRVVGPPERYKVRGDWKTAAENFAGDVYHVDYLHWSTELIEAATGLQDTCKIARTYEFKNGHSAVGHEWVVNVPEMVFDAYPPHYHEHFDLERLDPAQLQMMRDKPPTVGTIFPNLSFIRFPAFLKTDEPPVTITSIRQWQPVGPGELELWNWQLVWKFMSDEDVERAYNVGQYSFGSAGIFEQDDTVAWEGIPKVGASRWWRRNNTMFNFQQSVKSKVDQTPDPDWTGPGIHRKTGYGENAQLNFYKHYLHAMRRGGR